MSPRAVTHYAPLVQDATRPVFKVLDQLSDQKLEGDVYQYVFKLAGQFVFRVILEQHLQHFTSLSTPPGVAIRLLPRLMKKTSLRPRW
ncbi:hypothetical protein J3459_013018 [Metarhizium acridum]|uniref:uncharacterized protein n=1 Tax=Metarhizium acridum TaxID=92637 RepID=UPI001C6C84A9|nr:hypothetical protein J3458_020178 [Metarhizium acridum]KAG8416964.1 hypothetical protein J3459_013018 [Metarhizium acridum]